jgi:hypothetical protein
VLDCILAGPEAANTRLGGHDLWQCRIETGVTTEVDPDLGTVDHGVRPDRPHETRRPMSDETRTASVQTRPQRLVWIHRVFAAAALATTLLGAAAPGASASKPPAPPRVGPWKIILAINSPHGQTVTTKVIGGFKVTRRQKISDFHLAFTEEGETSGCAGGSLEAPKSSSITISTRTPVLVKRFGRTWGVANSTGTLGGGSLQPEEVVVLTASGDRSPNSRLSMVLVPNKGRRSGYVNWNEDECGVAFVVAPG